MWTYEGYWNAVLGANIHAADVVREFKLGSGTKRDLDVWLGHAEVGAWAGEDDEMPPEWAEHHAKALAELVEAAKRES
jgi:hypothetical protein